MLRLFDIERRHVAYWMALLLALWVTLAWYVATQHFTHELESLVEKEQVDARERSAEVADSFRRNLHFAAGVPDTFQHALRVWKAVSQFGTRPALSALPADVAIKRWTANPALSDLNNYLKLIQESLGVDQIFVVNAAGDCISASQGDHPGTPIGTNYADSQWFADARGGRQGVQYAMGRTTHVAGLYFSAPVLMDGQFKGAIVSKVNLATLSFLTREVDAYVTDINGVVIFAHDPDMQMATIPGAKVSRMSTRDKLALYRMSNFRELDIKPWGTGSDGRLKQVKNEAFPHVQASTDLPEYGGLTVYAKSDLTMLPLLEHERYINFALIALLGSSLILIIGTAYFHLHSLRQTQKTIEENEERLRLLLASVSNGIWGLDTEGNTTFVNFAAANMLGYTSDELLGKSMHDTVHHFHADGTPYPFEDCPMHGTLIDGKHREGIDEVLWRKDGRALFVNYSSHPIFREGKLEGAVVVFEDITERKQTDEALQLASSVYQSSMNGIVVTDENNLILDVNPAFTLITGYTLQDVRGKDPSVFKSGKHDGQFYQQMWQSIEDNGHWQGEVWDRLKNGELHAKWLSISVIRHPDGRVFRYVGQFSDITEKKRKDDLIWAQANFDTLTNLPNRRLFSDRLRQAMASSARSERYVGLLSLDLDQFKRLNDTFGHSMGDKLLVEVASRLSACVREEDTVARMGGDEFLVILNSLGSDQQEAAIHAELIAEKIRSELCRPYRLGNTDQFTSSSIGIILFLGHSDTPEKLLAHVDTAMYQAKAKGRNTICFFDASMQQILEKRGQLENALRTAIERNELVLHYQLQMNSSERPVGVEALLRWTHPQLGSISPAQFIPVAEESALILPIGQWVLETACAQLARWQADPLLRDISIAVNVSVRQFREATFTDQVRDLLDKHGIPPGLLKLELTESLVLDNIEESIRKMQELISLGVRFAMDDFGTGYSSLAYLSRLPIDQLKIDQSFVRDIITDQHHAAIVQAIISMAHSLKMGVIAEGVETVAQREFLELRDCLVYQGYLFAKPEPVDTLESKLKRLLAS